MGFNKDMVNGYEDMARRIEEFLWEGKPNKSKKITRTQEEFEQFLEEMRSDCWDNYNDGAEELGWKKS